MATTTKSLSRRGVSAKLRDKAIKDTKESQSASSPGAAASPEHTMGAAATGSATKNLLTKRQKKPAYMQSLNEQEKAENFKIIDNMNKKISYKKNPRYKINKGPILFTQVDNRRIKLNRRPTARIPTPKTRSASSPQSFSSSTTKSTGSTRYLSRSPTALR